MIDPMEITAQTEVVAVPDQFSCKVGGEIVILSMADEVYYGLDPVGARVWSLLETPTTVRRIRDALLEEFDVEADRCEADLLELLRSLAEHGLIRAHAQP